MNDISLVVFKLDEQNYALDCNEVRRILQVVDISPVPNMPDDLLGVINVEGEIITVVNIRRRLNILNSDISIKDFILIGEYEKGSFGFVVNDVNFTIIKKSEIIKEKNISIVKQDGDLIYILSIEQIMNHTDIKKHLNNTNHYIKNMNDQQREQGVQ